MNQLKINKSIDDFFLRSIRLKENGSLSSFLKFIRKVPDHAPFNNMLVFIQNTDCHYYATVNQWEKRFKRTIKDGARPMVILFPFGPVEFVYDISQTEGEPISDEKILYWWRENGGTLDNTIVENTRCNLEKMEVDFKQVTIREYLDKVRYGTEGYAQHNLENHKMDIVLHPRYSVADIESYGVLCHEVAHILLGHLGSKHINKVVKGITTPREIAKDRTGLRRNIMELEAELVAWIVFNSLGIEKNSEGYIASWMKDQESIQAICMSEVLKVAGKIQEMGRTRNIFK